MAEVLTEFLKQQYPTPEIKRRESEQGSEASNTEENSDHRIDEPTLIMPTEYGLTLRLMAQEHAKGKQIITSEKARANCTEIDESSMPDLNELLPTQAIEELDQIMSDIATAGIKNDKPVFLDLDDHSSIGDRIDSWVNTYLDGSDEAHGNAWLYFQSRVDLQNSEAVASRINQFINDTRYFDQNLLEKGKARKTLIKDISTEFRLPRENAADLADVFLAYQPLEKEIRKFLKNSHFSKKDGFEQAQERKGFLKKASSQFIIPKKEIEIMFDTLSSWENGTNPFTTLLEVNRKYKIFSEHKLDMLKPWFSQTVADGLSISAPLALMSTDNFAYGFGTFFGLMTLASGARSLSTHLSERLHRKIDKKINADVSSALAYGDFEEVSNRSIGKVYDASNKGQEAVRYAVSNTLQLSSLFLQPAAATYLLYQINPYLCVANLAGLAACAGISAGFGIATSARHKSEIAEREASSTGVEQTMKAMQELRLSPRIQQVEEQIRTQKDKTVDLDFSQRNLMTMMGLSNNVAGNLSGAGIAVLGGYLNVSPQALMSVFMYSGRIIDPLIRGITGVVKTLSEDVHEINRLHEITPSNLVLPNDPEELSRTPVSELDGHRIEIKDLNFRNILKGIDLTIEEGEFVTIVGPSGIGKSTLLKNILGLLKPDSGCVELGSSSSMQDTRNIQKLDPDESIFNLVAYCDQRPSVIQGKSLRYNLLFDDDSSRDQEVYNMMVKLGLYQEGIEPGENDNDPTLVNIALDEVVDRDFSGGQKVRMGLARALLRDSKILLLDEPSASLDPEAARSVRQLLQKIHKERPDITIICVTHDDTLIEESERIGRSVNMASNVNNIDSPSSLRDLITSIQSTRPDDVEEFLRDRLYDETGIDFYDLRRILVKAIDEESHYADFLWGS